jgi:hypothetical protein
VEAACTKATATERARILAIQAVGQELRADAASVAAALADPACTEAEAALRFVRAQAAARTGRLAALQGDETRLQADGAPSSAGTADGGGPDTTSDKAVAARIRANGALVRGELAAANA